MFSSFGKLHLILEVIFLERYLAMGYHHQMNFSFEASDNEQAHLQLVFEPKHHIKSLYFCLFCFV